MIPTVNMQLAEMGGHASATVIRLQNYTTEAPLLSFLLLQMLSIHCNTRLQV